VAALVGRGFNKAAAAAYLDTCPPLTFSVWCLCNTGQPLVRFHPFIDVVRAVGFVKDDRLVSVVQAVGFVKDYRVAKVTPGDQFVQYLCCKVIKIFSDQGSLGWVLPPWSSLFLSAAVRCSKVPSSTDCCLFGFV